MSFSLKVVCTRRLLHCSLRTSRNVHKKKWSFPQWVLNNLTLGLPYSWKLFDSTLHCLLKGYILSLLDALEEENIWEQGNYISLLPQSYMLESVSLSPFDNTLFLFPSLSLLCKVTIKMEDWSGGGPGGGHDFSVSTRCQQSLSVHY